jgi:hypothetical protein
VVGWEGQALAVRTSGLEVVVVVGLNTAFDSPV